MFRGQMFKRPKYRADSAVFKREPKGEYSDATFPFAVRRSLTQKRKSLVS